uniref:Hexosyltransferase n=1 Tax=Panagrolaimus sp. PS1159 TaxID=55785 RepID=A0AC35GD90_9BILA
MDTFLINFKDLKLKYHIKNDETIECKNKILLIIIPSRPDNFKQRTNIRNTWLADIPSTVIYRFIIGFTSNSTIRILNRNESQTFNDLIITDLEDSYNFLTLKTYALFQWQQIYCSEVKYILKADDDSIANVERLLYWIEEEYNTIADKYNGKVIFGYVMYFNSPPRNPESKWYIPKYAWPYTYLPSYCNGPSYITTSTAIKEILQQTKFFYYITVEDALFTGILAEAAGVQRIDKGRQFSIKFRNNTGYYGCDRNGMPYLTTIYHINANKFYDENDKQNPMKAATKMLKMKQCPNYLLSWFYWFSRYL